MRSDRAGGRDIVGRAAEWTAQRMGSAGFLLGMTVFIIVWVSINNATSFDPDFFVLNLGFSTMASYAAPLIMLAQNRSAARDRTEVDHDRAVRRQSKADMEYLTHQIIGLRESLQDLPTRRSMREDAEELGENIRSAELLAALRRRRAQR